MTDYKEFDFVQYLDENVKDYNGNHNVVIKLLPDLYVLLSSLLASDDLKQISRSEIYLTIGYLFYPKDVYPEEIHGPEGFIDDLMLILLILRRIKDKSDFDLIEELWTNSYPMKDLLEKDYIELSKEYKDMFEEVLMVTGIIDETYLG
jgi:uncharacterized membrane protein YkvA (DUF1232 family)|tara:strand:+ start:1544 stop:1987 length:444 start_codon:yes stop_codon:yes gene_type:complete